MIDENAGCINWSTTPQETTQDQSILVALTKMHELVTKRMIQARGLSTELAKKKAAKLIELTAEELAVAFSEFNQTS